ncbi:glycosyltransferase family 4 protein [Rhodopirellula baltica]|nr:glycosyltransferase family 1 protein [Rhodopirellula baltica]
MTNNDRPQDIMLNGRFLTRPSTGVERVAHELWNSVTQRLEQKPGRLKGACSIAIPNAACGEPKTSSRILKGRTSGQFWEQVELPFQAKNALLLNLCNLAPVTVSNQLVMIHDAQVFLTPESYSLAFRNWYRWILPQLGHRAKYVATVSEYSRQQLESFGVVPKGKAMVIPNGGDHILRVKACDDILSKHKIQQNGYFLAIGSLSPHKNIRVLLEALALRKNKKHPLIVAGGGNNAVFQKHFTGAHKDAKFIGRVTDQELKALYQNAKALLFPSIFEGFGLPPIEAMYCGCPVVASNTAAIPETCGSAALYRDPRDGEAWSDALDQIAGNESIRERMSINGHLRCIEYTWEASADKIATAILPKCSH